MIASMDINITKAGRSKLQDTNLENMPFGHYFTDHMLEADFEGPLGRAGPFGPAWIAIAWCFLAASLAAADPKHNVQAVRQSFYDKISKEDIHGNCSLRSNHFQLHIDPFARRHAAAVRLATHQTAGQIAIGNEQQ